MLTHYNAYYTSPDSLIYKGFWYLVIIITTPGMFTKNNISYWINMELALLLTFILLFFTLYLLYFYLLKFPHFKGFFHFLLIRH